MGAGLDRGGRARGRRCRGARHRRPLCHGIGGFLIDKLGAAVRGAARNPTLQLAFARLKRSGRRPASSRCHGADAGEWQADPRQPGPTPEHGLYCVVRAVAEHPLVAASQARTTAPTASPRLGGWSWRAGLRRGPAPVGGRPPVPDDEAVFAGLSLRGGRQPALPEPNVVVIERTCIGTPLFGVDDLDYVQRTAREGPDHQARGARGRAGQARLRADSRVWDIGAGSGSVGLEASRIARHGHVWAIEKNPADAANARTNARRLRASNYSLFEGKAPSAWMPGPTPTRCSSAARAANSAS